jgi:outer membrane receptor protein involved in Fe transport
MLGRFLGLMVALFLGFTPAMAEIDKQEENQKEQQNEEIPAYQEVIVVTVSKLQEALVNAPATVTVLPSRVIESSPAQNYGDLLRRVPGLNVIQMSARDINVRSRASTSTLVTSQLALLDGRTVYQDFFGFVLWDLLPINTGEIHQIEVLRGPASAIWGANAMTGVVNIITKKPREMEGTTLTIGFGGFDRSVEGREQDAGTLFSLNATHARVVSDRLAFKISAGTFAQSALPRPTGNIQNDFETPYPNFSNYGTKQPKLDVRFDYDFPDERPGSEHKLVFAGGIAATGGIIHTGIGPFVVKSDTVLGYGKVNYRRGNFRLNFFTNMINGEAPALLTLDADRQPINFTFDTQTYDVELGNLFLIGNNQLVSYGGNFRHNGFDLSLAPGRDTRDEIGGYIQDEIFISDHFRWTVGGRLDKFDVLDHVVFSPRTSFLVKPGPDHTFRIAFDRAFRAPSLVNNFLDTVFLNDIDLDPIDPSLEDPIFLYPVDALGNENLKEESLTAYELSYTGVIRNRAILSVAFYVNEIEDLIQFIETDTYDSSNEPLGWPLDPSVLDDLNAEGRGLTSELAYRNLERVRDKGIEISVDARVNPIISVFGNYSWQDEPEPIGFDISELNLPPRHRFNAGFDFTYDRYFGNLSLNFTDDAYWQDVLDARFHGWTESFTLIDTAFGIRWEEGKLTTSVKVTNLTNAEIQQHIFGDIVKRLVVGELRFRF